jgi:hypothetical protein
MKKINLLLLLFVINFGVYAQSSYGSSYGTVRQNSDSIRSNNLNIPDGFVLKDGKTVMVKDGKFTTLKNEITLSNGTIVMSNGIFKTKDGKKIELKEGDHLDLNGKLTTLDNSKTNNDRSSNSSINDNNDHQNNNMNDNQVK